jgi:hypothetical protein
MAAAVGAPTPQAVLLQKQALAALLALFGEMGDGFLQRMWGQIKEKT